MFKREMSLAKGRKVAIKNLKRGLEKARERLAVARRDIPDLEQQVNEIERELEMTSKWAISPRMLHVGAYLYLCGLHQYAPSFEHMKMMGRALPNKSAALKNCLSDALELGWATLDERGRFLWTPEGEDELTAISLLHEKQREWTAPENEGEVTRD